MAERVTIHGIGPAIKKLNSLGDPGIMKRGMNRAVQHIHRRIAKYPPKPAHSTYIRKGSSGLGGRWTTDVDQGGKRGIVGNITPYVKWVQIKRFQTWFHKLTGWKTDEDIAESEADTVVGYFEAEYRKAIRK